MIVNNYLTLFFFITLPIVHNGRKITTEKRNIIQIIIKQKKILIIILLRFFRIFKILINIKYPKLCLNIYF